MPTSLSLSPMPDQSPHASADLRQLTKPQVLALLKEAEEADRALAHQPTDSPARRANAFRRRRLLYLCGQGFQFQSNPAYYYTEERAQLEEERLLARARGEEAEWEEEQRSKRWSLLGFEPWPPEDMSDEEVEDEFLKTEGHLAALSEPCSSPESSDLGQAPKPSKVRTPKPIKPPAKDKAAASSKGDSEPRLISAQPLFFTVPGPQCLSPRDHDTIGRTKDYLFLAVLIERSRATGWIKAERQADGTTHCKPAPQPQIVQGKGLPLCYATKTLRRILSQKRDLWILRRYIQNEKAPTETITIGGKTLCKEGKWQPRALRHQLRALHRPIEIGKPDPFLASLHAQSFFSWCDLLSPQPCTLPSKAPEPPTLQPDTKDTPDNRHERHLLQRQWEHDKHLHHQLICPLCGPITPIEVSITSPAWTWEHLCGRAYRSLHCPHCLSRLHSELAIMN